MFSNRTGKSRSVRQTLERLFGKRHRKVARRQLETRRLSLELLDRREMMAADITANLSGGVYTVEGTDADDQIQVRRVDNQFVVENLAKDPSSRVINTVPVGQVKQLTIRGLGGVARVDPS